MNVEAAAGRADRPGRRAAAHRPLAQRPGGARFPALGARRLRPDGRASCTACSGRCWPRPRRTPATLMPGFTHLQPRPAGDLRPPPDGLCGDVRPRRRPLRRRPRADERVPAGRRGAGRHLVPDRPPDDRRARSASTGRRPIRLDASPPATSRWRRWRRPRSAPLNLSRLAEEIVLWIDAAVRLHPPVGRLHHRLVDHAAEAQSRRRRADPRQDRPDPGRVRRADAW